MKNLLRRMNRGVVLAIIVVFILIVYLIVDTITFNGSRPEIETVVKNYLSEFVNLQVTDTTLHTNGKKISVDEQKRLKSSYDELLTKYWTQYESNYNSLLGNFYSSMDRNQMYSSYEDSIEKIEFSNIPYGIKSFELLNFNPTGIKKIAPGMGELTVEFNYKIKCINNSYPKDFYTSGYYDTVYVEEKDKQDDEDNNEDEDILSVQDYDVNLKGKMSYKVMNTNNGWKIYSISGDLSVQEQSAITEEE